MNKSDQIEKLATALSKVQATMGAAAKDSENPFFHSKYADLVAVWDAARTPLTENGLAIAQVSKIAEPIHIQDASGASKVQIGVVVETVLMHSSGQWISGECYFPLGKSDPQGVGSAITYGRRYGMAAILGIVADTDDDGNAASGNRGEPPSNQSTQSNRQRTGQAVKNAAKNQASKTPPPADDTPTHTGPVDPDVAYKAKIDEHFGTSGSAFKRSEEIMGLCRKLNESGHATKWTFDNLESYVQDGYDKAIKQMDAGEVEVVIQDLSGIYDEWIAIKNEGRSVATPTGEKAQPPKGNIQPADDDPATPSQVDALVKMCDIQDAKEVQVMLHKDLFPGGEKSTFADLTYAEGKKAIKVLTEWKKAQ